MSRTDESPRASSTASRGADVSQPELWRRADSGSGVRAARERSHQMVWCHERSPARVDLPARRGRAGRPTKGRACQGGGGRLPAVGDLPDEEASSSTSDGFSLTGHLRPCRWRWGRSSNKARYRKRRDQAARGRTWSNGVLRTQAWRATGEPDGLSPAALTRARRGVGFRASSAVERAERGRWYGRRVDVDLRYGRGACGPRCHDLGGWAGGGPGTVLGTVRRGLVRAEPRGRTQTAGSRTRPRPGDRRPPLGFRALRS